MSEPASSPQFGSSYALNYDHIYASKDYDSECDVLERLFECYGNGPVRCVADIGCGTGNHSVRLAQRGYQVTGVDKSRPMLEIARQKAERSGVELGLVEGDARDEPTGDGSDYDVVLMMFAVLGYQLTDNDLAAALRSVRTRLRPGGIYVADFWFGPAVVNLRPEQRRLESPTDNGRLVRLSNGTLDSDRSICTVDIRCIEESRGAVVADITEHHEMRYFFPSSLTDALTNADLRLRHLMAFPDIDRRPDETTWSAALVAEAVST